jgi:hypothetical protein
VFPYVRDSSLLRAASLPMRYFSSSIAILELSYVNVRGWWEYPVRGVPR